MFVFVLPIGYGKGMYYACLPFRLSRSYCCYYISFNCLMEDQVSSFSSRGIRSARAGHKLDELTRQKKIIGREYQLVSISPEALLSKRMWRKCYCVMFINEI